MSDASHSEQLLSAYADGQLTGADKVRAEKLIADNPHYAELIEQWREQGQMIRALPRFRLDRDFSDRILAKHDLERTDVVPPRSPVQSEQPSKLWDGRTAGAAILALAAMILLTLFVFPSAPIPNSEVVMNSPSKSESADASKGDKANGSDSVATNSQPVPLALKSSLLAEGLKKKSLDDEELAKTEAEEVYAEPKLPEQPKFSFPQSNLADVLQFKSEADKGADGGLAGGGMNEKGQTGQTLNVVEQTPLPVPPISPADIRDSLQFADVNPIRNVDEVWFVDMKGKKPFEKLQNALAKNQIRFQIGQIENDMAGQSTDATKMELIHVFASKSQVHGAIALLTNEADILSYAIPSSPELDNFASAAGRMTSASEEGYRISEESSVTPLSTFAQRLRQERNLPRDLDYPSKMRSLRYFGTVFQGSENDQKSADESKLVINEKDAALAESRPLVAQAQQSDVGVARRGAEAKRLNKAVPDQLAEEKETTAPDDEQWYAIPDQSKEAADPGGILGPDQSGKLIAKEEKMKRFLLLIRFDRETDAGEVEVAPAAARQDDR